MIRAGPAIRSIRRRALLAALCGLWATAPADSEPRAQRLTPAEGKAAQQAIDRGALLYAYDQAAWHGTDALTEKLPDYAGRVGGWIVDGPAEAPQLVFFDKDEADPHAVFVADFRGTTLTASRILGAGDDRTLSPQRKALVAARRAAIAALAASDATACKTESFNTVVLPPAGPGEPVLVYVLTPQTDAKAIPMGGHYRIEVGADGRAGKPRPFTRSCLEMPFADEKGAKPEALLVTHLLDPVPTEIHVFSSLAAGLPVFVGTKNGRVWEVNGARIRKVSGD